MKPLGIFAMFSFLLVCPRAVAQWLPTNAASGNPVYRTGSVGLGAFAIGSERLSVFFDNSITDYQYAQIVIHGLSNTNRRLALGYNTTANQAFIQAAEQTVGYPSLLLQPQGGSVGVGGQPTSPERLAIFSDAGATGYPYAQFAIHGLSDPSERIAIGYDTVNKQGFIETAQQGVAYDNLILQPTLGEVVVGASPIANYERLRVNGDVYISGNIGAKYQDVAEWVEASEADLVSGMVVTIDPASRNRVIASATEYDTAVAGVVSERPGIILGSPSHSKVMVATTGRVRVRADASGGAIHAGDLLVTSAERGVAMRSEPITLNGRKLHLPGTIIGKALEPLPNGRGEILVLLSLQ